jgi:hypothetical protein
MLIGAARCGARAFTREFASGFSREVLGVAH